MSASTTRLRAHLATTLAPMAIVGIALFAPHRANTALGDLLARIPNQLPLQISLLAVMIFVPLILICTRRVYRVMRSPTTRVAVAQQGRHSRY